MACVRRSPTVISNMICGSRFHVSGITTTILHPDPDSAFRIEPYRDEMAGRRAHCFLYRIKDIFSLFRDFSVVLFRISHQHYYTRNDRANEQERERWPGRVEDTRQVSLRRRVHYILMYHADLQRPPAALRLQADKIHAARPAVRTHG